MRNKITMFMLLFSSLGAIAPDKALKKLIEGNERFAQDKLTCPERGQERRLAIVSKQTPFAVIVGCSDSRVSPDLVFDQGVGDLFVVRNAGNVVAGIELDSIEYGITHLHASLILVLGHANCGAVTAVLANQMQDVPSLAKLIEPAIQSVKPGEPDTLEKAIKANVWASVKAIQNSPKLKTLDAQQKIRVVGAYYHLESGRVEMLH